MAATCDWTISGSNQKPIVGTTHLVDSDARGVVLIAHGFKGYKDYGFIPRLAERLAAERFIAHRFNFSHSGMTHGHGQFDADLFRQDTWNRQVDDVLAVLAAIAEGTLEGGGQPQIIFGHSRGGVTAILAAGRWADDPRMSQLRGVIAAASPAHACSLTIEQRDAFMRDGYIDSPSSRTGQSLRVDAGWLREQQADPEGHDLATQAGRVRVPVGVIHGLADSTVHSDDAIFIAEAVGERVAMRLIHDGDHVFNTPNPSDADAMASQPRQDMEQIVVDLCSRWVK
ncbi:MAG: alpha/beta fold hydrolase [Phycisphaerales bacterium]|nr:alpha/beta fold hydrolase [Phycisphaerales bacterium]